MSERIVFSMRADKRTLRALEEEARRYRTPPRTLAEDILEEGVKMRRHPGIVFVERPAGRDAVLVGRPRLGVWMVVMTMRGAKSIEETAKWLSLDAGSIQRALAYAADYPEEIESAIAENDAAFDRVKRLYPPAFPPKERRRRRAAASR